jgi:hypothetical protein
MSARVAVTAAGVSGGREWQWQRHEISVDRIHGRYGRGSAARRVLERALARHHLARLARGVARPRCDHGSFLPDPEVFKQTEYSYGALSQRLRELSYLNSGLTIAIRDERTDEQQEFCYEGGIASFVADLNANKNPISSVIAFSDERDGVTVEIAMQWTTRTPSRSRASPTRSRTRTAAPTSPASARA